MSRMARRGCRVVRARRAVSCCCRRTSWSRLGCSCLKMTELCCWACDAARRSDGERCRPVRPRRPLKATAAEGELVVYKISFQSNKVQVTQLY